MIALFRIAATTTTATENPDPDTAPPVGLPNYLPAAGSTAPDVSFPLLPVPARGLQDGGAARNVIQKLITLAATTALLAAPLLALAVNALATEENSVTTIRVATFNTSLNRKTPAGLMDDLRHGTLTSKPNTQIANIAKIIRRVQPDIILLNEFDYDPKGLSLEWFRKNYLEIEDRTGGDNLPEHTDPVVFPYQFLAPSNTGAHSGVDFNNDARADGKEDVFGYGAFPGQYAMAVLSKFPIAQAQARTFQTFLWRDMPDAAWPMVTTSDGGRQHYYSAAARSVFRLSSKSHWDIPVNIDNKLIHLLASHPTPPVFDGPEDRNGLRNRDEIRFWADYINASANSYFYDDKGTTGGLPENRRFVILGDLNASPTEGQSSGNPIQMLLQHSAINSSFVPRSLGAAESGADRGAEKASNKAAEKQRQSKYAPEHTTNWGLRVDYVLPSRYGFHITDGGVFWPSVSDPESAWIAGKNTGSDHRLVWLDLMLLDTRPTD